MSRYNLKALGLALAAVIALSAFASSAASATEATFTSGSNWTTLNASAIGNQVFKIGEGEEVKCTSVAFDGSMSTDQKEITVEPTYGKTVGNIVTEAEATTSECTLLAGGITRAATIHTENCHYTFAAGGKTDGTISVTPTAESCEMKITMYFLGEFKPCFEVPNQTPTTPTVDYTNETYVSGGENRWDMKIKSTVAGIKLTRKGVCLGGHSEVEDTASYTGEVTVKGTTTEGKPVDVTWDPEITIATFTSGSDSTTLTSSAINSQVFAASTEQTVSCESIALDNATMGTDQSSVTVEPTYGKTVKSEGFTEAETNETECTATLGVSTLKAMVHMNGCKYKLTAGGKTEGSVDIECPAEKEIQMTVDFLGKFRPCFDIPAQTPETPTAAYTNGTYVSGGKNVWDVGVKLDFEGMKYKKTSVCGEGESKNGVYAGEVTLKGESAGGEALNVTWDAEI